MRRDGPAATVNALLSVGSPDGFADGLMMLDQITRLQNEQIRGVVELRDRHAGDQQALDAR